MHTKVQMSSMVYNTNTDKISEIRKQLTIKVWVSNFSCLSQQLMQNLQVMRSASRLLPRKKYR